MDDPRRRCLFRRGKPNKADDGSGAREGEAAFTCRRQISKNSLNMMMMMMMMMMMIFQKDFKTASTFPKVFVFINRSFGPGQQAEDIHRPTRQTATLSPAGISGCINPCTEMPWVYPSDL